MGRLGLTEALLVLALLFLVFAEYFIAFVVKRVLRRTRLGPESGSPYRSPAPPSPQPSDAEANGPEARE